MLDAAGALTVVDADNAADDAQAAARDELQAEQEQLTNLVAALGETQDNADGGPGEEAPSHEILFVDSQVEDVNQLLANLSDEVEVYFIDPDEDGVAFIADILSNSEQTYDAVHIVSHGDSGELRLGNATLTQDSLTGDTLSHLRAWGDAISEDGDILIYGCSVAEGDQGIAFVEELASITGADIAASTDDTGSSALGGDWDLEVTAGEVEADIVIGEGVQRSWNNLLALGIQDRGDLGSDAAADEALAEAISADGAGLGIDAIRFEGDDRGVAIFDSLQVDDGSGTASVTLMESGVVISTGFTDNLVGNAGNQSSDDLTSANDETAEDVGGDSDLDQSSEDRSIDFLQRDITIFEFDFTPDVQKLALGYVFSTEETYFYAVTQNFTDLFGIYIVDQQKGTTEELVFSDLRQLHQQANPDVVLTDYTGTDDGDNVEMNFVTTLEGQVVDLNDPKFSGFGSGQQYTIKFALADQGDSSLNSAAFFDYFGSSIRLDADFDDSSGATGFDFNNTFDTTSGPTPVDIVDGDVRITNYDEGTTSVTKVYVSLTNSSGTDELDIDLTGLTNISVASQTADYIELDWTGSVGSPTNIDEIKAALGQITYTNNDGTSTNADQRVIEIKLSDGVTESSTANAYIKMDGAINAATVNNLVTADTQPTLSGSFDASNANELQISVDGTTYTYTGIQSGGTPPAGLTTSGNTWSLNLNVAGQTLTAGTSYNILAENKLTGGAWVGDDLLDANELTVVSGGTTFQAADDTLTVDENTIGTVEASGILSNDLYVPPIVEAEGGTNANLVANFDATQDTDGNSVWEDLDIDGVADLDADLTLGAGVSRLTDVDTNYSAIGAAYQFDGTASATATATAQFDGNHGERSATFEWWIKVDEGLNAGEEYVLGDIGDDDEGFSVVYQAAANPEDGKIIVYFDDEDQAGITRQLELSLGGTIDPSAEFTQVAFTIDQVAETITIYVNGGSATYGLQATHTFAGAGTLLDDWYPDENANNIVIGGTAGTQGGVDTFTPPTTNNFEGQIASFRLWASDTGGLEDGGGELTAAQVEDNYEAIVYPYVSELDNGSSTVVIADPAGGTPESAEIAGDKGGKFTVFSNGAYTYDPNGYTADNFEYVPPGGATTDSITYTVKDASGNTVTATINVTVEGINQPYEPVDKSVDVDVDATDFALSIADPVDPDNPDDTIVSITVTELPSEGSVTKSGGGAALKIGDTLLLTELNNLEYDAPGSGSYSGNPVGFFKYEVDDGLAFPVEGTVTINVTGFLDLPTVTDDTTIDAQPTIKGTFNSSDSETLTVEVDGNTYTLGVDAALTNVGDDWTLNLATAGQTLAEDTYDVVATATKDSGAIVVVDNDTVDLIVDYIEVPTVDAQATSNDSPILTGTYDEAKGADLVINIEDPDGANDYGPFTLGDPGFTTDGSGNWTLDLSVAEPGGAGSSGTVLDDNETYNINAVSSGGGVVQNDETNGELFVLTTLGSHQGISDSLTVSEDDGDTPVAASGVLSNDINSISTLAGKLDRQWSADGDVPGNQFWSDDLLQGLNWDFGANKSPVAATSNFPGITEAYYFDGAGSTAESVINYSFQDIPGDDTDEPRTFEFWIKPDATTDGEYLVFEAGAADAGFSVTYIQGATNQVKLYYDDAAGGTDNTITLNLTGIDPTQEFVQVAVVIDPDNDEVDMYVNGGDSTQGTNAGPAAGGASGSFTGTIDDRSSDNPGAVGGTDSGNEGGTFDEFEGEVAMIRYFTAALTETQVSDNFGSVADHFYVTSATNGTTTINFASESAAADTVTGTNGGQFTIQPNGAYSYNPNGVTPGLFDALPVGASDTDTIDYDAVDVFGNTISAQLSVTINGVNDAPTADAESFSLDNSATATEADLDAGLTLLDGDTDPDTGDTLTVDTTPVSGPSNGSLTLNSDGTFSYTHNGSATTTDSFVYKVVDSNGGTDTATVSISINPNNPPTADAESFTVAEGGSADEGDLDAGATLLDGDNDLDGDTLTVDTTPVSGPSNGSLTLFSDGTFDYTHNGGETTTDSFVYKISDGKGGTDTATVSITVTPVNDNNPVADAESFTVAEGATATEADLDAGATLLDGDTDLDVGDTLTVDTTPMSGPSNGALTLNSDGTFNYEHNGGETSTDSFVYRVRDAADNTDTATVSITITPVFDQPPVPDAESFTIAEGGTATQLDLDVGSTLLDGDTDADLGDSLTVETKAATDPLYGSLTLNTDGTFSYTHDGTENFTDSFVYTVKDKGGNTAQATVSITITPVNENDPVADAESFTVLEGGTATEGDLDAGATLLDGDTDLDTGDTLSIDTTPVVDVAHGSLTLNSNGTFSYTHDDSENFTDSFVYKVKDAAGNADTATVSITVTPVNDNPPVADDESFTVNVSGTATEADLDSGSTLLDGDTDLDTGDTLTVDTNPVVDVTNGSLILNSDGTFSYTHNGGPTTTDSFEYKVTDAGGNFDTATVSITINNDITPPPVPTVDLLASSDSTGGTSTDSDDLTTDTTPTFRIFLNAVAGPDDAVAGDSVQLYLDSVAFGAPVVLTGTDISNGYVDITTSALADAAYSVTADVSDQEGNTSAQSSALVVTIDTTVAAPFANFLATSSTTPTLSGTYDSSDATTLVVEIVGEDSYTLGTDSELTTIGDFWQLEVPGSLGLSDGTYEIKVSVEDTLGNTATDASSNELIINTSDSLITADDILGVTEDSAPTTVPADGVLSNDLILTPDPAGETVTTDRLRSEFVASDDDGANSVWEDTGTGGYDLTLGSGVSYDTSFDSNLTNIDAAYKFDGTSNATAVSGSTISGELSADSATFELWLKLDDLTGADNDKEYILLDAGDDNEGFSIVYRAPSDLGGADTEADGQIVVYYHDDNNKGDNFTATLDLNGTIDPTEEFFQLGVRITDVGGGDNLDILINGGDATGGLQTTVTGVDIRDWSRADAIAIGSTSGQQGGGSESSTTPTNFSGYIASFRLYDDGAETNITLTDTQMRDNYLGTLNVDPYVSKAAGTTSSDIADPEGGSPTSATIEGSNGGEFIVKSDGSYTYDPNGITAGAFDYLVAGATTEDTFVYTVTTPDGQTDTATVTVTVTGINDAPTAPTNAIAVDFDSTGNPLGLTAPFATGGFQLDPDTGDGSLTITVTQLPSEGVVKLNGVAVSVNDTLLVSELLDPGATGLTYDGPDVLHTGNPITDFKFEVDDGTALPVEGSVAISINSYTGFIANPTVDSLTTNNTLPTITGTFSDTAAEELVIKVDGKTYTATDLLSGPQDIPPGLVLAGNTWTLDLDAAGQPALAGGTYNIEVTNENAAMDSSSDTTSGELVIDLTGPSAPTVVSQTTISGTPTITGTWDSSDAGDLVVTVNKVDYTLSSSPELSTAGDNWTLNIPSSDKLLDDTYSVTAVASDPYGNTTSDVTAEELIVDSSAILVINDDTLTVGEDDGGTLVPADGILTNDIFAFDASQVSAEATNIVAEFIATTDGSGTWADGAIDGTANLDRDLTYNTSDVTFTSTQNTNIGSITGAYELDGSKGAPGLVGTGEYAEALTEDTGHLRALGTSGWRFLRR